MHRNMEVNFILKTIPECVDPDSHFWHLRGSEGMPCLCKPSVAPGSWCFFFQVKALYIQQKKLTFTAKINKGLSCKYRLHQINTPKLLQYNYDLHQKK